MPPARVSVGNALRLANILLRAPGLARKTLRKLFRSDELFQDMKSLGILYRNALLLYGLIQERHNYKYGCDNYWINYGCCREADWYDDYDWNSTS